MSTRSSRGYCREVRQLREEREILKKPPPGLLGRAIRYRRGLRTRESESGEAQGEDDVPNAGSLPQRVLRLAGSGAIGAFF